MDIVVSALYELVKELTKEVLDLRRKKQKYESVLESMESTLTSMKPIIEKIIEVNEVLHCENEETESLWKQMKEGKLLLAKCSQGNGWCCFKKNDYSEELLEFRESLKTFCQTVLQAYQLMNQKKILVKQEEIHEDVHATLEVLVDTKGTVEGTSADVKDTLREVQDNAEVVNKIDDKVTNINQKVDDIRQGVKSILGGHMHPNQYGKDDAVTNDNTPFNPCVPPEPPEHTFGLDKPLKDLKEKLLQDGMSVIALSGPGGCGKTTLAKKLCREEEIKGKFQDKIFFVTVSKTPNLKVIIQQLFLHSHYKVPEFKTDEDAINQLGQLMNEIGQKPILLVLDDVWSGSDSFVDMFKFQIADYKILVTSRSSFPRFDYTFKLEPLNDQDSMGLFRHSACLEDGSIPADEVVVNQAVKACKGFPLALTVVGRSLCRQPSEIWQKRVTEWSKGGLFKSNVDLLNHLTSSLDVLNNELKESYLDLGSFPEGQWIPATALIDMWAELYKLDEDDRNSIANLHELSNLNLVNLRKDGREGEGYYDEHFVLLHDLLRDLVNHLSRSDLKRTVVDFSGNRFPEGWTVQKQLSARLLSISTDENFSSNWGSIQAPEVEVVVLNFRTKNYSLPKFLFNMEKLKSLIVTKYGFSLGDISNLSLVGYMSNLKRIRLEQVLIPSLTLTSMQLENLRKISLYRCKLGQAFENPDNQISEIFPNLVEISIGDCVLLVDLPVGICNLLCLKRLSITRCHELTMLPQEFGKLVNLEMLRLRSCSSLLELPSSIGNLHKLSILDLSDCHSLKNLPEQVGELQNLRKLYMTGCSNCKFPKSIGKLLQLVEVACDAETAESLTPLMCCQTTLRIDQ